MEKKCRLWSAHISWDLMKRMQEFMKMKVLKRMWFAKEVAMSSFSWRVIFSLKTTSKPVYNFLGHFPFQSVNIGRYHDLALRVTFLDRSLTSGRSFIWLCWTLIDMAPVFKTFSLAARCPLPQPVGLLSPGLLRPTWHGQWTSSGGFYTLNPEHSPPLFLPVKVLSPYSILLLSHYGSLRCRSKWCPLFPSCSQKQ